MYSDNKVQNTVLARLQCNSTNALSMYSKACLKRSLKKKTKIDFHDRLSLNAGQKYCNALDLH